MIRFDDPSGADACALRLAIASSRAPLRIERGPGGGIAVIARAPDLEGARPRWLRAGLDWAPAARWPEARPLARGVLEADGRAWCVGATSVDRPAGAGAVLLLTPIARDDALRSIAAALSVPLRWPLRHDPRRLARTAAAVAGGSDGVVLARAYLTASGTTAADALQAFRETAASVRPRARLLRAGAERAWREIAEQSGGVWRALSTLEEWWS